MMAGRTDRWRLPQVIFGLFSVDPLVRGSACQRKPRDGPCPHDLRNRKSTPREDGKLGRGSDQPCPHSNRKMGRQDSEKAVRRLIEITLCKHQAWRALPDWPRSKTEDGTMEASANDRQMTAPIERCFMLYW